MSRPLHPPPLYSKLLLYLPRSLVPIYVVSKYIKYIKCVMTSRTYITYLNDCVKTSWSQVQFFTVYGQLISRIFFIWPPKFTIDSISFCSWPWRGSRFLATDSRWLMSATVKSRLLLDYRELSIILCVQEVVTHFI